LIGNDDAEASGSERHDLAMPGIPEFGKAVEQNDGGAALRAGSDSMQFDVAVAKCEMFEGCGHRGGVYAQCGRNARTRIV
jgi:hypothetical protein